MDPKKLTVIIFILSLMLMSLFMQAQAFQAASADNEIDVISGATVTTNAVTNAVNGAILAAEYLEEG